VNQAPRSAPSLEGLRRLLYEPPSPETWAALCALVEGWREEALWPLAADYAAQHLEGWPDALREAPHAWWRAARAGAPPRGWPLARAVRLGAATQRDADALLAAIENNHLRNIAHWKIVDRGGEVLGALCGAEGALAPRALELERAQGGFLEEASRRARWWGGVEALIQRPGGGLGSWSQGWGPPLPPGLRSLALCGEGRYGVEVVGALLQRSPPPTLASLSLVGVGLTAREVAVLGLAPWRGQLRALDLSENGLDEEAGRALALLGGASGLSRVRLWGHRLSAEGRARLRVALPGVSLEFERFSDGERATY
jgi:hypothetical protein